MHNYRYCINVCYCTVKCSEKKITSNEQKITKRQKADEIQALSFMLCHYKLLLYYIILYYIILVRVTIKE